MKAWMLGLMVVLIWLGASGRVLGQGTAFTYQGRLNFNNAAANGNFDLQFGLYTNVATGNFTGGLVTNANTAVSNGLFTTTLSFGNVFSGAAYWLEIGVRTNGSTGSFTILTPRQAITPTPYAITANNASNLLGTLPATQLSGALPAGVLAGVYSNGVSFTNGSNVFSGNGSGLTGLVTPTQGNYLFATDTNTQVIANAEVFQNITFSSQLVNGGWGTSTSGIFTAGQTGLYLVQYQVHVQNGYPSYSYPNIAFAVRGVLNLNSEISGSESIIDIPPQYGIGILSKSFLLQITAGQTLSFQVASQYNGGFTYIAAGAFAGETYPGVALTIVRIQ